MDIFDSYHKWLGIPLEEQPPNHYRLLGLRLFEHDADVIEGAADKAMAHVRCFQNGPRSKISQRILNELATARGCLLNERTRCEYDALIRADMKVTEPRISAVPPPPGWKISPEPLGPAKPAKRRSQLRMASPGVPLKVAAAMPDPRPLRFSPWVWGTSAAAAGVCVLVALLVFTARSDLPSRKNARDSGTPTAKTAHSPERSINLAQDAVAEPELKEKWPIAMTLPHMRNAVNAAGKLTPPPSKAELDQLLRVAGFYAVQDESIQYVLENQPSVRRRLLASQGRFEANFGQSVRNIDRILRVRLPNYREFLKSLRQTTRTNIGNGENTTAVAEAYCDDVERRSKGEIPSPYLETLLLCHPKYVRNRAAEFHDHFTKEYRSDGSGKSRGIKFRVEYPGSWKASAGTRPHIVQKFNGRNGQPFDSVMVMVKDLPVEILDVVSEDRVGSTLAAMTAGTSGSINFQFVDQGRGQMAGHTCEWAEYRMRANRLGVNIETYGVMFGILHKGKLVTVNCDSSALGGMPAKERFYRTAPVYQLILAGLDLFDRYDD